MNGIAAAKLYRRPNMRRGTDYGFDERESALIKADFPNVEITFDIDKWRMQVWAIGDQAEEPHCIVFDLKARDQYRLRDILTAAKYEAASWKPGKYDRIIREQLAREHDEEVAGIVDSLDPRRIGESALRANGIRSAPVAMGGAA